LAAVNGNSVLYRHVMKTLAATVDMAPSGGKLLYRLSVQFRGRYELIDADLATSAADYYSRSYLRYAARCARLECTEADHGDVDIAAVML